MERSLKCCCLWLCLILLIGFTGAQAGSIVKNTQKSGYIEQSINRGDYERINYLITDWSKLRPLQNTSKDEQSMFLCLIAADMLKYGMSRDEYFAYLDEKGLAFDLEEIVVPTENDTILVSFLRFTPRLCLILQGDPIIYAEITMDSPFEIPQSTSISIDLYNFSTPYKVMTDDGSLIPEAEYNIEGTP